MSQIDYVYATTPTSTCGDLMNFGCFCSFPAISSLRRQRNQTRLKMRNRLCYSYCIPPGLLKNAQKSLYVTILAENFRGHVKNSKPITIYRGNKTTTKDILKHMNKRISNKEISVYVAVILVILMALVIACNPGMDENISALKQFLGAAIELAGVASIFYLAYVFVNWIDKN